MGCGPRSLGGAVPPAPASPNARFTVGETSHDARPAPWGRSLARALAPRIRVLSISPAAVATDFVPGRSADALLTHASSAPLQLVTEPDDVALAAVAALTHLRHSTGTEIVVDAGKHL